MSRCFRLLQLLECVEFVLQRDFPLVDIKEPLLCLLELHLLRGFSCRLEMPQVPCQVETLYFSCFVHHHKLRSSFLSVVAIENSCNARGHLNFMDEFACPVLSRLDEAT